MGLSVKLDELEVLERPVRIITASREQSCTASQVSSSEPFHLVRVSIIFLLSVSFTIFIYGLMLERMSWLLIVLSRDDQPVVQVADFLLLVGYCFLSVGFSYYLFLWSYQQHRIRLLMNEMKNSTLGLDPMLISSRQPILIARCTERYLRNFIVQGVDNRILSLTVHVQLPYRAKFAGFQLKILPKDDGHDHGNEFYPLTIDSSVVTTPSKKKIRKKDLTLLINDRDAHSLLVGCLKEHSREFHALLKDKSFKYLSVSHADGGGFAIYKIIIRHGELNRQSLRQSLRILELLVSMLVREHEPKMMSTRGNVMKKSDESSLIPSINEKSDVLARIPSMTTSNPVSSFPMTEEEDAFPDDLPIYVGDNCPSMSSSSTSPVPFSRSWRIKRLQDEFRRLWKDLLFSREILIEIEGLLDQDATITVLDPTHLVLTTKSSFGMLAFHWIISQNAADNFLMFKMLVRHFWMLSSFNLNFWRKSENERWQHDETRHREQSSRVLSDSLIRPLMDALEPPVYLSLQSDDSGHLELWVRFSSHSVQNVRRAYILGQELPWLLLILF